MKDKEEKIKHLKNLKSKVDRMKTPSQSSINELEQLIINEYYAESKNSTPKNNLYLRQLDRTVRGELNKLTTSTKQPRNRNEEFQDCKKRFKQDIDEGLLCASRMDITEEE